MLRVITHVYDDPVPILKVENLRTYFRTEAGVARAVDGVSFHVNPGETLGIVGESGSGKSVTSLSVMRLIPQPPGEIQEGSKILFRGRRGWRTWRRRPRADAEDPRERHRDDLPGADDLAEPGLPGGRPDLESLRLHQGLKKKAARERAIEMLQLVGIPIPRQRVDEYPHQLSGGMRQRVMIAMALACDPKLLIADEPTTALDVTIQAQILELLNRLQEELGMSIILITHDLGVVAETCDRVIVMYAGQVFEEGPGRGRVQRPAEPLHGGAAPLHPAARQQGRPAGGDPRRGAEPDRLADRMPLPRPLPVRLGEDAGRGAAALRDRTRPQEQVLAGGVSRSGARRSARRRAASPRRAR
jgi:peptide/nickel transport system ATP-binding protein